MNDQTNHPPAPHSNSRFLSKRSKIIIFLLIAAFTNYWNTPFFRCSTANSSYGEGEGTASTPAARNVVHVIMGLSGNHPGFVAELEIALKSLLLSAPLDRNMTIHLLADQEAYDTLEGVWNRTEIGTWQTRNLIVIISYNVEPYKGIWKQRIMNVANIPATHQAAFHIHTLGTWFRLFAHEVLPSNVEIALYMDVDVVLFASLDELWRQVNTPDNYAFQWGASRCAGFMVFNVQKIKSIWDCAWSLNLQNYSRTHNDMRLHDQMVLMAVEEVCPNLAGRLSEEWDISIADGIWRLRKTIVQARPKVAMMHFNGGSSSKEAYFVKHSFIKDEDPTVQATFGLANFYVRMPWTWARYVAASQTRDGRGYTVEIQHQHWKNETSDENKQR